MKTLPEVSWDDRKNVVEEVLPDLNSRQTFLVFIEGVANAVKTRVLLKELQIDWPDFADMYRKDPRLYALYLEAKTRGGEYRQILREEEADRRAMEGTTRAVYHKGKVCGEYKEYSDNLLALQLKAGDPDKYADRNKTELKGAVLNLNVEGVTRAPVDED